MHCVELVSFIQGQSWLPLPNCSKVRLRGGPSDIVIGSKGKNCNIAVRLLQSHIQVNWILRHDLNESPGLGEDKVGWIVMPCIQMGKDVLTEGRT